MLSFQNKCSQLFRQMTRQKLFPWIYNFIDAYYYMMYMTSYLEQEGVAQGG